MIATLGLSSNQSFSTSDKGQMQSKVTIEAIVVCSIMSGLGIFYGSYMGWNSNQWLQTPSMGNDDLIDWKVNMEINNNSN